MAALRAARVHDRYVASVAIGIVAAVIAVSVHIQVDYIATNTNFSLLWLYAGLAAALSRPDMKIDIAAGSRTRPTSHAAVIRM
jgi:hypothetical protein